MGPCPRALRPGGVIQAPTSVIYSAAGGELLQFSWQVEKMVLADQQSVLGQGKVPSNRLFIPENKVAVPLVQANVCQWGKKRRCGCTVLLQAS